MRVAVYARYSSEHQNERSIDDQVRLCREHADRLGWMIVEVYADYAISGAHLGSRPRAQALMEDAKTGRFDIVLAEAMDRLSRDQEDIAGIYKRLVFAGVRIVTVSEGDVSELHVGLKGTMNALFIRELAIKIRRGQRGRVVAGRSPGGLSYGYTVAKEYDAKGEPVRGGRAVNDDQAEVIRRIFREYAAGMSARAICHGLNADGVPGPNGGAWRTSTIAGNRARGSGILWNDGYRGRLVYNRLRMVKDPDTGRRLSRPNPPSEWLIAEAPDLRIVDEATWAAVQAVHERYAHSAGTPRPKRPRHLLSGLLRCGVCGGAYVTYATDKAGCAARRDCGPCACANDRTVKISDVNVRVLGGLRDRLLRPKALAAFVSAYDKERKILASEKTSRRKRDAQRLGELGRSITRAVDAICEGTATPELKRRLVEMEAEKARLESEMAREKPDTVVSLHPAALEEYRRNAEQLFDALAADSLAQAEAATLLRAVIDRIDVVPLDGRGCYDLKVVTRLETLIGLAHGRQADRLLEVVAEEGFEPPTQGL
ncbi:MAG: recombinase family protein [Rhodospirillales bacterium]|nr:recombinase family protein [Rhodospirillales bacterium]